MPWTRVGAVGALILVSALGRASTDGASAHEQSARADLGLSGYVLAPDGAPVSTGTVVLQRLRGNRTTTSIDRSGRFRLVPDAADVHQLRVTVPGLAPYRVNVTVPASRTVTLPVIRLLPGTYFRVMPSSGGDEPVVSPRLRHRSVALTGAAIAPLPDLGVETTTDNDGYLTIGPLPQGITALTLESPPLAPVRLPDLYVTGADALLDGGTVVLDAGAVLHADLVDAVGAPVPGRDVVLEEMRPLTVLPPARARTDATGRATFDRLASGRYRVRTVATKRCNGGTLSIARVVPISGRGPFVARIVADGTARFRLTSPFGPMAGALVTVSPNPFASPPLPGLRTTAETAMQQKILSGSLASETFCSGYTDRNGRLTLANFPPGPAHVSVQFPNSRYVRRLTIPEEPGEITLPIPDGLMPVFVSSALGKPLSGARLTWIGGGGRVEAQTLPSGHALLESVGTAPGVLVVTAAGHEPVEAKLAEPPGTMYEVALTPTPSTRLQARVITELGEPAARAVVALTPESGLEDGHIAVADAKGVVTFSDVPAGTLQLTARAEGFATATALISDSNGRTGSVLTLPRGYRAILNVELPPEEGPQLIRVVNETGRAIADLLDIASDRGVAPPGRLSLGPFAPGTYVIELRGVRERRQVRITIAREDVVVSIR